MINWKTIVKKMSKRILPSITYHRFERFGITLLLKRDIFISQLLFSYFASILGRNSHILYPKEIFIFLTTRCNIRCFICRRENTTGQDLDFDNIFKLERAIKNASVVDLTGWGEPLLYPKFKEVLQYIYSINTKNTLIRITTNGTMLSSDIAKLLSGHLNKVTISLNAATKETYNRDMQRSDFQQTINNISVFVNNLRDNDRLSLCLHFVAHSENFREIPEFVKLASFLNIPSVTIGNYFVGRVDHARYSLLLIKDEYNQIITQAEKVAVELNINLFARKFYVEKRIPAQLCMDPYKLIFILPNGDTRPCCYSGDVEMGNVYTTSFESVWFGNKYRALRKSRHLPACKRCNPHVVIDDPEAHFLESLKRSEDVKSILSSLSTEGRPKIIS